ncbi:MAG: magnesium/cobalt transporter CorA [Pseudomonadota bacterium]|jgi:magnesium transporter
MSRYSDHTGKPAGSSPGTVMYIGEERLEPVTISFIRYSASGAETRRAVPVNEVVPPGKSNQERETQVDGISWYTIDGVHDEQILNSIGEKFGLHGLVLEDIANTKQRPKIEEFDEYIFVAMKMITFDEQAKELVAEHVSLIIGDGYVLSFLENEGDVFEPVRQRIASSKGRIRKMKSDYLAYALMDAIVDNYFAVLEDLGDQIDEVEDEVVEAPTVSTLRTVHHLKRELIFLRRSVWPMREVVNTMLRDESDLVREETRIYLRDLYDHTIHVIDTVETLRDIVAGMLEVYLSSVSNKLNQVMKVLTVMSSIFIPLTFVAGVYGMNFKYMPELEWYYGYPAIMLGMLVVAVALLAMFRRKEWL